MHGRAITDTDRARLHRELGIAIFWTLLPMNLHQRIKMTYMPNILGSQKSASNKNELLKKDVDEDDKR